MLIKDRTAPTAQIAISDNELQIGETSTITIIFSEKVKGFTIKDLTAENGQLVNLIRDTNDPKKYFATFIPNSNITDSTNIITLSNTYTDLSRNRGKSATSSNYIIDTKAPTATITLNDNVFTKGETSIVTIKFSEKVAGVELSDFTVENGTLSNLSTTDNITYTALLTPNINTNDDTNIITLSNNYTDIVGNQGIETVSDNYSVSTVDLSFYAWNGLNGYNVVKENISDDNLTIYLNYDSDFNTNAQILESDNANIWMLVSGEPTTQMIDQWIAQILDFNSIGGQILGLSLDMEPWSQFLDQNDPNNMVEWQEFLDFVTYVGDNLHNNGLLLSISMPFWTDNINSDVFPNNRPIVYDIIDIADETIIMDYTTNLTNFINFAANELSYADSVNKDIKIAIETSNVNDDNISFYSNPEAMIPFLQTSFDNSSFAGYTIHYLDAFANLSPSIVL
ncbi:MAG: hypothetical protein IE880_02205 [Epsilonproteobacteria bacterium]|nr:hypothetical protein [Campylobacterota bacterium]